jgi:hypothetical protein
MNLTLDEKQVEICGRILLALRLTRNFPPAGDICGAAVDGDRALLELLGLNTYGKVEKATSALYGRSVKKIK